MTAKSIHHGGRYIGAISLQCTCSSRLGEEAEKVGARISDLFPWGPDRAATDCQEGGEAGGRGEFMCLGRVKGTRVATSAANGRRTAGCSGQGRQDERGNAEGDGCTCASRVASALSRQIPFPGSFPTARARRGGPFSGPGESAASRIREGPRSAEPGIRESGGGSRRGVSYLVESCRR